MSDVRVLISYSHDGEGHRKAVLNLTNRLREAGVDAWVDQFEEHEPPESWPDWMRRELEKADFVLVVVTERYLERFNRESAEGVGSGVRWEGALITAGLYHGRRVKARFLPVVLRREDQGLIPSPLDLTSSYVVGEGGEGDLSALVQVLQRRPGAVPAILGSAPSVADLAGLYADPKSSPELVEAPGEARKEGWGALNRHGEPTYGPTPVARTWLTHLHRGDVHKVWEMLDRNLRLALAQDWITANSRHPDLQRLDWGELANTLAERDPKNALAWQLMNGRVEVLRDHYAAWAPETWAATDFPRWCGREYAIVVMAPIEAGDEELLLLMRSVGPNWCVANFRAAYVIPGWPPRQEEIPGPSSNGGT